jgi:4-oxalocrotonate tautomerase
MKRNKCPAYNGKRRECLYTLQSSQPFYPELNMPYVNIRIAGSLTREQKARIAAEITDTLERIALKPKRYTYVAFDELPDENWAIAGKLLDED